MRKVVVIFMICSSFLTQAQQEPLFTQYYVNDIIINPAISGSKQYSSIVLQSQKKWLGFDNAPMITSITYQGALNNQSAIGGYLMHDNSYPFTRSDLNLSYAYHIPLDYDEVNLSFGISADLLYYNLNFNDMMLPETIDPAFTNKTYTKILPNASAGVYLYAPNFYLGYSSKNLIDTEFKESQTSNFPNLIYRSYYGVAGYRFLILNNDWQIEPSLLYSKQENSYNTLNLTTRIIYLDNNWAGVTLRNNGNIGFNFGLGLGTLNFGYSFDHTFRGDIAEYNYGTHEFTIEFSFENLASKRHISYWGY